MGLRQLSFSKGTIYILVQCLGSIFAALVILIIIPYEFQDKDIRGIEFPMIPAHVPVHKAFIMQFIGSAFYVWTYYALIVDSRAPSNIFGFAIGSVSALCDLSFGPMIGGCINPVNYIGPRLVDGNIADPLAYLTAPLLGGIFAGFYFDFFVLKRKEEQEIVDDEDEDLEPEKPTNTHNELDLNNKNLNTFDNSNNTSLQDFLYTKNNSNINPNPLEPVHEDVNLEGDDNIKEVKEDSDSVHNRQSIHSRTDESLKSSAYNI